ncbi:MAG: twin-arginine translocase TatA/TatE family subunit [Candidatus Methanoperedens sp.]|nr:twin-arginine translocase TatA/TatE family subunit [Candidatus Methanoperedens sp.]
MIGYPEMILILVIALFLFGPDKLPEMARSLGKAAGEFKRAQIEAEHEMNKALNEPSNDKESKIKKLAVEMGLDVNNKTTEQLVEEIRTKIKSKEGTPIKAAGI